MRASNAALAEAGARVLEEAWWPGAARGSLRLLSPAAATAAEGLHAPFLAVVRAPLDWRAWVRRADGRDARGLDDAAARAALAADDGVPERIANAVLAAGNLQSVFFPWDYAGEPAVWCRISAQVYNEVEDYAALARAVLAVKAAEGA